MDIDDIIKFAFFIIVILFSAVSQFLKERPKKRAQQQRRAQQPGADEGRQLPPRPQANAQAQPVPQKAEPAGLEAEIEDFLRQVTGQDPKPAPPAEPEPVAAQPVYVEPEVIEAEPASLSDFGRESIADHVQHHIREGGIDDRDSHLASGIENRDEKMDEHLHEVFDHNLGTLRTRAPIEAAAKVKRRATGYGMNAAEILKAFESPEDIRKAIILKEILTPKSLEW